MFKRFQVMDLFHINKNLDDVKEWVDIKKELPKTENGIFQVKIENGNAFAAYYFRDRIINMMKYVNGEPSHWWNKQDQTPLYNVTHWGRTEND